MAGGGDGRLGYHTRNEAGLTAAPYLEWANHVVDLPSAFPAFVPQPVQPIRAAWCRASSAARSRVRRDAALGDLPRASPVLVVDPDQPSRAIARCRSFPAATLTFAGAVMIAVSIVWKMQAAEPVTVAAAADGRAAADRVEQGRGDRPHVAPRPDAGPMRGRCRSRRRCAGPARRRPRSEPSRSPSFRRCPPAPTLVSVKRHDAGDGLVMVGVGNDQFAIVMQPIGAFDARRAARACPVGARTLTVRADEAARDQLDGGRAAADRASSLRLARATWRGAPSATTRVGRILPRRPGVSGAVGILGGGRAGGAGGARARPGGRDAGAAPAQCRRSRTRLRWRPAAGATRSP